jgi:hypothetical protein
MGVTAKADDRILTLRVVWFAAQAAALAGGVGVVFHNSEAWSALVLATLLVWFAVVVQFATRLSWLMPMSPVRPPAPLLPGFPPPGRYVPIREAGSAPWSYASGGPVRPDEHAAKVVGEVNGHAYLVAVCPECGSVNRWVRP